MSYCAYSVIDVRLYNSQNLWCRQIEGKGERREEKRVYAAVDSFPYFKGKGVLDFRKFHKVTVLKGRSGGDDSDGVS